MRVRDGGLDYIGYHSARRAPQALSSAGEIDQGADSAHICQKNKREREPGRGGWWATTSVGPALCGQRRRIAQDRQGKWRRRSVAAKGLPVLRGISITTGLCSPTTTGRPSTSVLRARGPALFLLRPVVSTSATTAGLANTCPCPSPTPTLLPPGPTLTCKRRHRTNAPS